VTVRLPGETLSQSTTAMSGAVPDEIAHLRLQTTTKVELGRVAAVLGSEDAPWLGERAPSERPDIRHFYCDLELHAGGVERAIFRKSAIVGFGEPRHDHAGWIVPIEWHAATLAPLFPVFAGHLRVRADRIELEGSYAPPGGKVGQALDASLLGIAARATGRWFVHKLGAALA
jgi:hypothetical protein